MSSLSILSHIKPDHLLVGVSETLARHESFEVSRVFFARPYHIHLVLPLIQEVDVDFSVKLERELYPYRTVQNKEFHSRILKWQRLTWGIISIPRRDEPRVQAQCRRHHRYLDRGAYTCLSEQNKSEVFPFKGDNFRAVRMVHGLVAALL